MHASNSKPCPNARHHLSNILTNLICQHRNNLNKTEKYLQHIKEIFFMSLIASLSSILTESQPSSQHFRHFALSAFPSWSAGHQKYQSKPKHPIYQIFSTIATFLTLLQLWGGIACSSVKNQAFLPHWGVHCAMCTQFLIQGRPIIEMCTQFTSAQICSIFSTLQRNFLQGTQECFQKRNILMTHAHS